jgi:hypothetical protein
MPQLNPHFKCYQSSGIYTLLASYSIDGGNSLLSVGCRPVAAWYYRLGEIRLSCVGHAINLGEPYTASFMTLLNTLPQ